MSLLPGPLADLISSQAAAGRLVTIEQHAAIEQLTVLSGPVEQKLPTVLDAATAPLDLEDRDVSTSIRAKVVDLRIALDRLAPVLMAAAGPGSIGELALDIDVTDRVTLAASAGFSGCSPRSPIARTADSCGSRFTTRGAPSAHWKMNRR